EPRKLHLHLRSLFPQGDLLRVRRVSRQKAPASRLLLPERCREDVQPVLRAFREAGDGEAGLTGAAMAKQSAGLLLYRFHEGALEFFLVHPGGPFWAKKD